MSKKLKQWQGLVVKEKAELDLMERIRLFK